MGTLQPAEHDERVERRVRDLEACVERLSERLSALETSVRTDLVPHQVSVDTPRADTLSAQPPLPTSTTVISHGSDAGWITLIGRTSLVLAGAFLLRALTDAGRLPTAPGVWIGLVYALLWLTLAGARGHRSGLVHGVTALIIALPLVAEGATRFHVLDATAAALVLSVVTIGALAVAWQRRLSLLALAAVVGLGVATLVIAIALGSFLAPTLAVVVVAMVACGLATDRHWTVLAWFAAFSADVAALLLTVRASATPALEPAQAALVTVALVGAGFLGLCLWRTRRPQAHAGAFEAVQTTAALAVAIGASMAIAGARGIDTRVISVPALLVGAALYVYAFSVFRSRGAGAQFYYFGMTAFGLALAGLILSVAPPAQTLVLAAAAVIGTITAVWRSQPLLALQGTLTAVAAAISGGLVSLVAQIWVTRLTAWPSAGASVWIVLAATLAALLIPRSLRHEQPSPMAIGARLALALTLAAGLSTVAVMLVGPWLAGARPDPGVMATIKTVTLAAAALVVALASRVPRFAELSWITYALLGAGALKIVLEDFPVSSPSTLFVALAALGVVLIAVPKVLRK